MSLAKESSVKDTKTKETSATHTEERQAARVSVVMSMSRLRTWASSCRTIARKASGSLSMSGIVPRFSATYRLPGRPKAYPPTRRSVAASRNRTSTDAVARHSSADRPGRGERSSAVG